MTDKQGSSDVARVCDLRDNFREQGDWSKPGPCELDAAKDAAALTRILAEREADQEALKRADELADLLVGAQLTMKVEAALDVPHAITAYRAARSGEGR